MNVPIDTCVNDDRWRYSHDQCKCWPNCAAVPHSLLTLCHSHVQTWSTFNVSWLLCKQERQCTYKRNIEARSHNNCGRRKLISITYSECVPVALVIQHAKRVHHTILSSVACPDVRYFFTLFHKRHVFRKKVIEHKMCVLTFSTTFVWKLSHSKTKSARYYHKCTCLYVTYPSFMSDFN
jgi:hypothetical protein